MNIEDVNYIFFRGKSYYFMLVMRLRQRNNTIVIWLGHKVSSVGQLNAGDKLIKPDLKIAIFVHSFRNHIKLQIEPRLAK